MQSKTRVGFVGLGHAGWPMCANLVKAGHDVVVHDVDRERARAFAEEHRCDAADSPQSMAGVEVVITMLPNGRVVRDVMTGPEPIADVLDAGAIVIDTSSSDPQGTRELGAELAERGLVLLDAPVTMQELGGAAKAQITIMVGGDDEGALERAEPVLSAMCSHLFRVGPLGAGHATKTLNNYVSAAGLVAALDALVIGHRYGLDAETTLAVLNAGTGRNFSTAHALPQEALTRRYATGFSLALLIKDLGIARDLANAMECDTELAELLRRRFAEALDALGGDPDHTEALRHWEQRGDVELPTTSVGASAPVGRRSDQ
jgi:3-hydroxyisobutyrate dehydrogenase